MKKCPYCAEHIQDEAIVCRYCGRDLEVGPPDTVQTKDLATDKEPAVAALKWGQLGWIFLLAGLLSFFAPILLAPLARALFGVANTPAHRVVLFLAILVATFPLGYWAGHAWPGKHLRAYVLLGLCVGLIEWLAVFINRTIYYGVVGLSWTFLVPWFVQYEVGIALVVVSGALLGDLMERRRLSLSSGVGIAAIGLLGAIIGLISTIIGTLAK